MNIGGFVEMPQGSNKLIRVFPVIALGMADNQMQYQLCRQFGGSFHLLNKGCNHCNVLGLAMYCDFV